MKRLLLLGGGHAHVEVLRDLAREPLDDWEVTCVSPFPRQLYSGMIPGFIAGHYTLDECAIDLVALSNRGHAAFRRNSASLADPGRREVVFSDGTASGYDLLSLDIGAGLFTGSAQGVERHAIPIRPMERAAEGWMRVLDRARRGEVRSITLVGGGPAGVEVALAMDHRLKTLFGEAAPHVRVVSDTPQPLMQLARGARARLLRRLAARGIGMHAGSGVTEVGTGFVRLESGLAFASDATFWTAGAAAPDLVRDSGFACDARGFLLTNDFLQSVSHASVFGAGDCATQANHERPKAGVFAVRAAPTLAANLRAAAQGRALKRHVTGQRYLALVSAGTREAVCAWNGLAWEGGWAWRWKDRIDRRFVARYAASA